MKKKDTGVADLPLSQCINCIGGRWKPLIISMLHYGVNRFGKLKASLDGISKQMLTDQLRELEADGIIIRKTYSEKPPRVEYFLTGDGKSLLPLIDKMQEWGRAQLNMK